VSVLGDHSFIDVTAGASHSLGLKDDGTVWMWGSGGNSQMGNPLDTAQKTSPVLLVGQTVTTTFADICVGDWHTIGVCPDKTIMAWGWNNSGQLGVGDRTERHSPVTVLGNHSAAAVAAGEQHSLILKADGSVWAWGLNNVGQLGDGSTTSKSSPISVLGGHSFAMIAAAHESSAGLKSDGSLWTWGDGDNYRSGHGDLAHKSTPTQVIGGHVFRKVAVGDGGFMGAIDDSGRIWMWGVGSAGQLGNNASQQQSIPQVVYGNYAPHTFTSIYAGPNFNLATRSDGTLWSWGVGSNGQLGNNDTSSTRSPVSVVGNHSFIKATATMFYGSVVNNASLALKADGTCWAFGASQFVDGTNRSSPVAVAIGRSFIDIAGHSGGFAGLGSDGRVWTWGNDSLILAHATGTTPQSVPGVLATKMAFGSNHGIALKADGTLLSWGSNAFGCLGIGNTLATSVPTSVLGNHTFAAVAAGFQHSAALKADGSAWCWGNNSNGEVGDGTTTHRSSPVSVVGNHSFVEVKAGFQYTIALKSDGSVWGWGNNSNGNVGDNTLTNRSSPVIIGNWPYPGSFAALSAGLSSFGLKSDGKLYGWGQNGSASLGDNSNTDRSLPTAIYGVENAHSFVDIACGASHTIALDSNGAVWGWGSGSLGQNGIGSGVQYASSSIPVLMPGQRKFVSVSAMGNRSAGITNDGCLFAWGDVKATEALDGGDQITSAKSVPVSVTRIFSGQ
jgi:alpha-tubulin suppressor-like RCC1 family protein